MHIYASDIKYKSVPNPFTVVSFICITVYYLTCKYSNTFCANTLENPGKCEMSSTVATFNRFNEPNCRSNVIRFTGPIPRISSNADIDIRLPRNFR